MKQTPLNNRDFSDVVLQQGMTKGSNVPTSFRPIHPTSPITSGDTVQIGNTVGRGNGTTGVALTTTAQGTGTGPTAPQTIVAHLKVNLGNQTFWLPLVQ